MRLFSPHQKAVTDSFSCTPFLIQNSLVTFKCKKFTNISTLEIKNLYLAIVYFVLQFQLQFYIQKQEQSFKSFVLENVFKMLGGKGFKIICIETYFNIKQY